MTPTIWVIIVAALILAGAAAFGALRLGTRRMGSITVMALFLLSAVLGIVAILSVTLFRKVTTA